MGSFWVAVVTALGASGLAGALVAWWKDRDKDDADVTRVIREISRDAVVDARDELRALRTEMRELTNATREMRQVLREVVVLLEADPIIAAVTDHPITASQLAEISARVRTLV